MTANNIIEMVSVYRDVPLNKIKGQTRKIDAVNARHGAMWLIRKNMPFMSLKQIGFLFGGRDHSTVIHGIEQVDNALSINSTQFKWVNQIELGNSSGDRMLERLSQALVSMEKGRILNATSIIKELIELRRDFIASIESMKADQMLHEQTNQS
jgi:hypothetical protein